VAGTAAGGEVLAVAEAHSVPGAVSRLTAGTTSLTSLATGSATQRGRALVFATSGDVRLASVDIAVSGAAPGRLPSRSGLMAVAGSIAITGNATIAGTGNVVLGTDAGAIAVGGMLTATAGLGIVDTIFTTPPAAAGTIAVDAGIISASGDITLSSPVRAAAGLSFTGGNAISLNDVTAAAALDIDASGRITTGALRAGTGIDLVGSAITAGAITTTSGLARIAATGDIGTGAIAVLALGDVSITAGGSITVAAVSTPGGLGLVAGGGSVVAGAIAAGPVAVLLARGSVKTGAISTGRSGTVFIGDAGQAGLIADDGKGGRDYTALLAAAPAALPGDVLIGGTVTTGQFRLAGAGLARISGTLDAATRVDIDGDTVQLALVRSGGAVRLRAAAALSGDGLQAGGAVLARGNGLTLGAVTAAGAIELVSDAAITVGALRGDGNVKLDSRGTIRAATISAGNSLEISVDAAPGTPADIITAALDAGITAAAADPQAGYQIGLATLSGSITTGAIAARGNVGLLSQQGAITTGAVATDRDFAVLARTGITTGGLTVGGSVTLADAAMAALLSADISPLSPPAGFDLTPLQSAAKPLRLAGDIGVGGPVVTGGFSAAATGRFSSGSIDASSSLFIDAAALALGHIRAGVDIGLDADTDIVAGTIRAGRDARLAGAGSVRTATISVGDRLFLRSGGRVDSGDIAAGTSAAATSAAGPAAAVPGGRGDVLIGAGGDVSLGNVAANGAAGVISAGRIVAGTVTAGSRIVLLADTGVTSGTLTTPLAGGVFIGAAAQRGLISFDAAGNPVYTALFAADPVPMAGDIVIDRDVTTGIFKAAATDGIRISGTVTAALGSVLDADSQVLGDLSLGGPLSISVDSALIIGNIAAAGAVALTSLGDLTAGSIVASGGVSITARAGADGTGDVRIGDVRSEADIRISAVGNITAGALSAADSIFLRAALPATTPATTSATTPATTAAAPVIRTGNIDTGITNPLAGPAGNFLLFVESAGTADVGNVRAKGSIGIIARGGALVTGDLAAGSTIALLDGLGIATGAITTPDTAGVFIASHRQAPLIGFDQPGTPDYAALFAATPMRLVGDLTINGAVTTGLFKAAATGTVTIGTLAAAHDIYVDGAALALGSIAGGSDLELISDTALTLGNVRAEGDIDLSGGGRLVAGSLSAGDSVTLVGAGVTTASISAGITAASRDPLALYGVGVRSTGAVSIGTIDARGPVGLAALDSNISAAAITTGESLALLARTGVTVGSIRTPAGGLTLVAADTMATLVTKAANGNADYTALANAAPVALAGPVALGGSIDTGTLRIAATGAVTGSAPINATGAVTIRSGALALGAINAGGLLDISSTGTLALGALRVEGGIDIEAGDTISIAGISAGDSVAIGFGDAAAAGASLTTGSIDAGSLRPSQAPGAAYQVGVSGRGAVSIGAVTARGNIGLLSANGSISVGAVSTTAAFAGLAATGFAGTSISTGPQSAVYVANASMFTPFAGTLDALGPAAGFDFAALFALAPVRIGGPLALSGAVVTGRFTAAASGAVTLAGLAAGTSASIDSGALASFGGTVTAPAIIVSSADIAITGGLGSSATSAVTLNIAATASAITLGGSNDSGGGYVLGSAEAGRIAATTLTIAAQGNEPAAMTVQALNFAGSGAATNGRTLALVTGGSIRINGALALTGAGAGDTLRLSAGRRIEIATDAGGRIDGTASGGTASGGTASGGASGGGTLGGTIDLSGADVWVGTSDLLGQLAANSGFAGRDAALAAAAAVPDLAGALAADRIMVAAQASFLVQNSGSVAQKAGFSAGSGGFSIRPSGTTALDLVINGRAQDAAGAFQINQKTVDVVRFASVGDAPVGFAATATVNNCSIGKICGLAAEQGGLVVSNIGNTVAALTQGTQASSEAAIEEAAEQAAEEASDAAENQPQTRLNRLVDLSVAIEDAPITEPITGEGNPTLWLDLPADAGVKP
jgi:hypothetical protein